MQERDINVDDPLDDFEARQVTLDGATRTVYVAGSGPAVVVMHEMPGISPPVARFARWVRAAGFTVYMPSLFGRDGAVVSADEGGAVFERVCVSAEFSALASRRSSKITGWLRALARLAHAECGGPGVGAVGMCFTGNFGLTMLLEPAVIAPILSQPALPLNDPAGLEISPPELGQVRARMDRENLSVIAFRFRDDPFCTAARFAAYSDALGARFNGHVIPDEAAKRDVAPFSPGTYLRRTAWLPRTWSTARANPRCRPATGCLPSWPSGCSPPSRSNACPLTACGTGITKTRCNSRRPAA